MSEETTKKTSGLAIAGLVLGILAAVTSFLPIINNLSFIMAIVGGILAAIALVGATRGKNDSKGLAIAGVVLAVVSFVIVLATQSLYSSALKSAAEELKKGDQPVATSTKDEKEDAKKDEATSKEDTKAEEAKADEAKKEDVKKEEPKPDYSNMKAGETVTLENGLDITVNSFSTVTRSYSDETLVCANVTYKNNGSENVSFNTLDWKSENADGAEKYSTYYTNDEQLESGKLKKGGTVTGNVYFEGDAVKILYYSNLFQDDSDISWTVS